MAMIKKSKELTIIMEDRAGMLAELTSLVAGLGVNIQALSGWGRDGQATFMLVTADNKKVQTAAAQKGWKAEEKDVVIVDLPDAVGACQAIAERLKAKKISLNYCYATTCSCPPGEGQGCACRMVLRARDADAVMAALK